MLTQDTVQLQGLWCDEANYELPRFFVRKYSKKDMLTLSATLAGPREMKSPASLQANIKRSENKPKIFEEMCVAINDLESIHLVVNCLECHHHENG